MKKQALLALALSIVSLPALAVMNGVEEPEANWPATAKLYVLDTHLCTGTFLSDTVLLTARHCVDRSDPTGNVRVDSAGVQVKSLEARYLPVEDDSLPDVLSYETDLAIVLFPAGTGAGRGIASYPEIAGEAASPWDEVFLLGYGGLDIAGSGAGTLRSGANYVMFSDEAGFSFIAANEDQNVAPGDSGSAAYVNGRIVGVATLAGDVFGYLKIAGFRALYDGPARELLSGVGF